MLKTVLLIAFIGWSASVSAGASTALYSVPRAETAAVEELEAAREELASIASTDSADVDSILALGITLYRLGRIDEARDTLESLLGTTAEHRAKYHLGLIAELEGQYDRAKEMYTDAAEQDADLELQARADNALWALSFGEWRQDSLPPSAGATDFAYVSGKSKFVDGLVDPDDTVTVDEADMAFELLLAGSLSVWSPGDTSNLSIGANIFREDYVDFSDYDLQLVGLNSQYRWPVSGHLLRFKVGYADVDLGGDDYLAFTDFTLTDTFSLSDRWNLQIGALYRDIGSDNADFDHLAGRVLQTSFGLVGRDDNPWRFDYQFGDEDRGTQVVEYTNDAGDVFEGLLAYSRQSHRLRGRYALDWNDRLSQSVTVSARFAEYADASRFLENSDDTELSETIRDSLRTTLETELSWSLSQRLRLLGNIEWLDEQSNIDLYDYSSTQIGVGIDYIF